jgi:hypothetical protein
MAFQALDEKASPLPLPHHDHLLRLPVGHYPTQCVEVHCSNISDGGLPRDILEHHVADY